MLNGERFQVISSGGLDNQSEWFTTQIIGLGDTIVSRGGQYQEYLRIEDIGSRTVWLKRYGFAKGLGKFDEAIEIEISNECTTSGAN